MPIYIGTGAKHFKILGICPFGIPELMGSIKMLLPANMYH
jgi:hypothetical protein